MLMYIETGVFIGKNRVISKHHHCDVLGNPAVHTQAIYQHKLSMHVHLSKQEIWQKNHKSCCHQIRQTLRHVHITPS